MSNHTKGEWKAVISDVAKVMCSGQVICSDLYDPGFDPSIEEIDANARLLAAAPELLTALINIVEGREDAVLPLSCYNEARLAIRKALGESA